MMADRRLRCAVGALGFSVLLTAAAFADQSWQGYAQRCQTTELAAESALANPCQEQLAVFGLAGPQVLGRRAGVDVEATGSINDDSRRERRESARSPL